MNPIELAETGLVPDWMVRFGIRRLLASRLRQIAAPDTASSERYQRQFAEGLRRSPLAVETEAANEQHYEVPAEFFQKVLGPRLKYSSCLFSNPQTTLSEAEEAMLEQTCQRAEIADGMRVLELGCGWGSLTLWMAERFPGCEITALSNSASQREFIERSACDRGLNNIRIITADMREFQTDESFDRIVSVEMFEHMRNYELLFNRISNWLTKEGKAFVHVFCHRDRPYLFETEGASNWMGRHFFTGGTMLSENLFGEFTDDLAIEQQWRVNGLNYWRTCEAWQRNLDRNRSKILNRFRQDLSFKAAKRAVQRWRMFFMACAELFRYSDGNEWFVAHYRFSNNGQSQPWRTKPVQGSTVNSATTNSLPRATSIKF